MINLIGILGEYSPPVGSWLDVPYCVRASLLILCLWGLIKTWLIFVSCFKR